VIAFLAFSVIALTSPDERMVRGTYLVMAPDCVVRSRPAGACVAAQRPGVVIRHDWGLFRHYWAVLKLGMTVFCIIILLIYIGTFRQMAGLAPDPVVGLALVRNAPPVVHATLALILLLVAAVLGVYKPFGMTVYSRRKQDDETGCTNPTFSATDSLPASASTEYLARHMAPARTAR